MNILKNRRIVCAITGRTWPQEKAFDLIECTSCGRRIDKRVEAWSERVGVGRYCDPCMGHTVGGAA